MNEESIVFRVVKESDIPGVVDVFCTSFPESVQLFFREDGAYKNGLRDIFLFLSRVVSGEFFVAEAGGQVVGYVVFPRHMRRIWWEAFRKGFVLKAMQKLLTGAYGINVHRLYLLAKNKLYILLIPQSWESGMGQILSLAVAPQYRRQKIGNRLLAEALDVLACSKLKGVKLEVRPHNAAALNLYTSHGFRVVGKARGIQGPWLIMVRKF